MRLEKNMNQKRRLNHWRYAYAQGTRYRLDRGGLEGSEYSEKKGSQVLDMELAQPKENISRLGKKEKPAEPRSSGSRLVSPCKGVILKIISSWQAGTKQ